MPILRPCLHHGCPNYIDRPNASRCAEHQAKYERNRQRAPSSTVTWRAKWKRIRAIYIEKHRRPDGTWLCAICHRPISSIGDVQVDHVKPVAEGGAPFDESNFRLAHARCNRSLGGKLRQDRKREAMERARAARRRH